MKLLNTFAALLPLVLAAPAPPNQTSRQFKLKSHVLSPPNQAFENLYLNTYHIAPAYNYAVLEPQTDRAPGIIGHLNGTAKELARDEGDLIFDFSGAQFPYGFVIDQVNATYNPILINAGNGTKGIFVDQGVIKYHNPMSGGFYGKLSLEPSSQGCSRG